MTYCPGSGCPLRNDCYHHTQPTPSRNAFAALPYDPQTGICTQFYSNIPAEQNIREAAYHLWLKSGQPEHRAAEHWHRAYQLLCTSTGRKF